MLEEIFNLQSNEERATYTMKYGIFLAKRMQGRYVVNFYKVDDFFAEIWITPDRKSIFGVKSFSTDRCFEPYLDLINIDISVP